MVHRHPKRLRSAPIALVSTLALAVCGCATDGTTGMKTSPPDPSHTTAATAEAASVEVEADVAERVLDLQQVEVAAIPMNDFVYRIEGEGAFFLINTSEGAVLIDTGTPYAQNEEQMAKVRELASGPIRKVIVTHAHSDHSGGLPRFEEAIEAGDVEFVAHHRYGYMSRLQDDLLPYFKKRYHVLYPNRIDLRPEPPRPYWNMEPTRPVFPGSDYRFELGGVEFVVIAPENGGEGEDGILVWLPESRILFTGDLFGTLYPMFPNLYTVRGEKYRDPLDYIDALDIVLDLKPVAIGHSHFRNAEGEAYIQASVEKMRDAVQYMWDEVVAGMNGGKTVWELMRDIELPQELELSQGHGKVSWSVRATWEIIAGWFYYDTIANLYHVPPTAIHDDLVDLAGGADRIAARARVHLDSGRLLEAIRLLDVAAGRETRAVLGVRIDAVTQLLAEAKAGHGNHSEVGLLEADLQAARSKQAALAE